MTARNEMEALIMLDLEHGVDNLLDAIDAAHQAGLRELAVDIVRALDLLPQHRLTVAQRDRLRQHRESSMSNQSRRASDIADLPTHCGSSGCQSLHASDIAY